MPNPFYVNTRNGFVVSTPDTGKWVFSSDVRSATPYQSFEEADNAMKAVNFRFWYAILQPYTGDPCDPSSKTGSK